MNKVILIGRLARDPEMRTTGSGIAVTRFTVAVDGLYNSQTRSTGTDFINCVAWRKQAENLAKYCNKGSQIAVDGRIQSRSYDSQDGQKHYVTEVTADNITFLGSRSGSGNTNTFASTNESAQEMPTYNEPQSVPTTDVSEDPFKDFGEEVSLSDDDLPF